MNEYVKLLALATQYMVEAEAMIEALQGRLGIDTRESDNERVANEIKRRIAEYEKARNAMIAYAREKEVEL